MPGRRPVCSLAVAQKPFNFSTLRAAKAPERVHFSAAARRRPRACRNSCFSVIARAKAPWNTSPAPRVSTVCTGKAGVSRISVRVEPDRALGPRVPARNDGVNLAIFFSAWASSVTSAVSCSGSLENIRWEEAFSRPSRSDHRAIDVDDHGNAAPDSLGAEISAEHRAAALGEDGGAVVQQRVEVGQFRATVPDRGRSRWYASPEGSIITAEIGVTSPGMWMRCFVSMPSCAI